MGFGLTSLIVCEGMLIWKAAAVPSVPICFETDFTYAYLIHFMLWVKC